MPALKNLAGKRFGRLEVIKRAPNVGKRTMWRCRCKCGKTKVVDGHNMVSGNTESCGCLASEKIGALRRSHGLSKTPLHYVWIAMRARCNNPKNKDYPSYGGRGISVCPAWDFFQCFRAWAVASGYKKGLTLERKNNDLEYSPDNCRWATRKEQAQNRRDNPLWKKRRKK